MVDIKPNPFQTHCKIAYCNLELFFFIFLSLEKSKLQYIQHLDHSRNGAYSSAWHQNQGQYSGSSVNKMADRRSLKEPHPNHDLSEDAFKHPLLTFLLISKAN